MYSHFHAIVRIITKKIDVKSRDIAVRSPPGRPACYQAACGENHFKEDLRRFRMLVLTSSEDQLCGQNQCVGYDCLQIAVSVAVVCARELVSSIFVPFWETLLFLVNIKSVA